jgi:predicted CXXCH cytochrome family protein
MTAWRSSQHAMAMENARPSTVLGRFDSTRFSDGGVASIFFRRGEKYFVNTVGADGQPHDYEIRYTFGVSPLQQYLVELNGGFVQPLFTAWDARPVAQGGQRWFSLSPGTIAEHGDAFHWTGRAYNWNFMCADCHSTAVRKGYDASTDRFRTTMTEINVSCESCHGPGSRHAKWARYPSWLRRFRWSNNGLANQLTERHGARWSIDSTTGNARRSSPRTSDREIETCAQCHARRSHIADGYVAGRSLFDYYTPLLLMPELYFPDGQQRDEVYTYGSFLQSKMYSAGVTCSDCHEPHSAKLRQPGNGVCAQCHRAAKYDTTAHHFHPSNSAGARCVSCHLPDTTYMQIDPRHDHSIRIPRPDRSVTLGVPNACNRCHTDRDSRWAAAQVRAHYPNPNPGFQRFAESFAADDRRDAHAGDSLTAIASDVTQPAIVRGSAIARLGSNGGSVPPRALEAWVRDASPLVRLGALQALELLPPDQRLAYAVPLLSDATRSVRQGAAWVLAPASKSLTTPEQRGAFSRAAAEFIDSQRYNADRAPNRIALGVFYAQLGQLDSAATELRAATLLEPTEPQPYLALAEVLRVQGRTADAVAELERAASILPRDQQIAAALRSLRGQR